MSTCCEDQARECERLQYFPKLWGSAFSPESRSPILGVTYHSSGLCIRIAITSRLPNETCFVSICVLLLLQYLEGGSREDHQLFSFGGEDG